MKTSRKVMIGLFITSTAIIAITGVFTSFQNSLKLTKVSGEGNNHTITLTEEHLVDAEIDDVLGPSFTLRKENATKCGYYFESTEGIAYDYEQFTFGNGHILSASEGSYYATIEIEFELNDIKDFVSATAYGEFYDDNDDTTPDAYDVTHTTFQHDNVIAFYLNYPKLVLNSIVITYSCNE